MTPEDVEHVLEVTKKSSAHIYAIGERNLTRIAVGTNHMATVSILETAESGNTTVRDISSRVDLNSIRLPLGKPASLMVVHTPSTLTQENEEERASRVFIGRNTGRIMAPIVIPGNLKHVIVATDLPFESKQLLYTKEEADNKARQLKATRVALNFEPTLAVTAESVPLSDVAKRTMGVFERAELPSSTTWNVKKNPTHTVIAVTEVLNVISEQEGREVNSITVYLGSEEQAGPIKFNLSRKNNGLVLMSGGNEIPLGTPNFPIEKFAIMTRYSESMGKTVLQIGCIDNASTIEKLNVALEDLDNNRHYEAARSTTLWGFRSKLPFMKDKKRSGVYHSTSNKPSRHHYSRRLGI